MAEPIQIIARFPGIAPARNYQVTFGWGVRPEYQTIETTYNHPPTQRVGSIQLISSAGPQLVLPYCRVVRCTDEGLGKMAVTFEDRRWLWRQGFIDGNYNEFDSRTLTYKRPKNPQELAALCLAKMREQNYDISALPTDARPFKSWVAANPADELENLAAEFGLVVVLDPITDRVKLCRYGVGAQLPDVPTIKRLPGVAAQPLPSAIQIVGGTSLWQTAFSIGRALAREVNGELVPLNSVSYTPAGGWSQANVSPTSFGHIKGETIVNGAIVYHRDLAQQSVYRYYELGVPAGGWSPQQLVGTPYEPTSLAEMGPFLDTRLEKDPVTDSRLPIVIRSGCAFDVLDSKNKSINGEWTGNVQFPDPKRPIFQTDKPLFRYTNDAFSHAPATGRVILGHAITVNGQQVRWDYRLPVPAAPAHSAEMVEYHDEIVREMISLGSSNGGLGNGVAKDNKDEKDAESRYYAQAIAANLVDLVADTIQVGGMFLGANLDGAIRRMVWSGGPDIAPSTTIARNNEPNPWVIPLESRPATIAKKIAEAQARKAAGLANAAKRKAGIL